MDTNPNQAAADRLAAKLANLDLDQDEQAVLVGLLCAGATSVEPGDEEVAGFGFAAPIGLGHLGAAGLGGLRLGQAADSPTEQVTFEYGGLVISYGQQHPDGGH